AHVAQALYIGIGRGVGALHHIALVVQDFGDAAHADAADTDEVHRAEGFGHDHDLASIVLVPRPASCSARSASFSTARGCPRERAAAAACGRIAGSVNRFVMRVPSDCGDSVACSATHPPPAASTTSALFFWSASIEPGK